MRIAVVGGGMAGLGCGEALRERGHEVAVFDKGRRPGGRMSTKALPTAPGPAEFDYGAPRMIVRDPAFQARVELWRRAGVVAPWPEAEPDSVVGTPGMSAPLGDLAGRLDARWSTRVIALAREGGGWRLRGESADLGRFDAAAVAVPAEQVAALVGAHDPGMAARAARAPSRPCWTAMAAFAEPLPVAADVIEADQLASDGAVASAWRNSSKPGRGGPDAWVIHAGARWSAERLEEEGEAVAAALLAVFGKALGKAFGIAPPAPLALGAHRWRYAGSGGRRQDRHRDAPGAAPCLWNPDLRLGLCGDWFLGPEVEAAWRSGTALACAIAG